MITEIRFKIKELDIDIQLPDFEPSEELANLLFRIQYQKRNAIEILKKAHQLNLAIAVEANLNFHFSDPDMADIANVAELLRKHAEYKKAFNKLVYAYTKHKMNNISNKRKAEIVEGLLI